MDTIRGKKVNSSRIKEKKYIQGMQKDEKKKTTFDVCPDGRKKEKKNTKNGLITFFDAINLMINYIRHLFLFVI